VVDVQKVRKASRQISQIIGMVKTMTEETQMVEVRIWQRMEATPDY
jgi:hypothetical protein